MTPAEALLSQILEAARSANYARLGELSAMLETVSIPHDTDTLSRLARLAGENAALLDATARGIRSARQRIDALRHGQRLTTYDSAGRRRDHDSAATRAHRL